MKVLVRDEAGLEVCLDFDYGDTVGDVRNTLNAAVSAGCGVAEEALVPQPFDRYMFAAPRSSRGRLTRT